MAKEKVAKIRITRNRLIAVAVFILAFAAIFAYENLVPKPVYSIAIDGNQINFREDLRAAARVKAVPSEEVIYAELMGSSLKNITIAFKPVSDAENAYYSLEGFLLPKLSRAYTSREPPQFSEPMILDSYEGLKGTPDNLIIAMVHPVYSDETVVVLEDHVIYIKAKDYRDFDLATEKLFVVAFGLEL